MKKNIYFVIFYQFCDFIYYYIGFIYISIIYLFIYISIISIINSMYFIRSYIRRIF